MRTLLTMLICAAAIVACTKTELRDAAPAPVSVAKSAECDSLQAVIDSLQQDRFAACTIILSISKHWDQMNERLQNDAVDCCAWSQIAYEELWTMRYYIELARDSDITCDPQPYELDWFLVPPTGCPYTPVQQ